MPPRSKNLMSTQTSRNLPRVTIFALGHNRETLAKLDCEESIIPIDLNRLDLDKTYSDNRLAESRFFLSMEAAAVQTPWVGVVSANWNNKYPHLLLLKDLATGLDLASGKGFAPIVQGSDRRRQSNFLHDLTFTNPGMKPLLEEMILALNVDLPSLPQAPWANTFIIETDLYLRFLSRWRVAFNYIFGKYGFEPPFYYLCPVCGGTSSKGIGKYDSSRHVAYLLERVSMLLIAEIDQLHWTRIPARFNRVSLFGRRAGEWAAAGIKSLNQRIKSMKDESCNTCR